jgi:cellulose synthase/poly-beta-1,6-N-acetylglucosamine synthase-like glycosyltransferase
VSAVIPYGLVNTVHTHPAGSPGLPVDDGTTEPPDEEKFVVRVLVPCYKEGLDVVGPTVDAALTADLPPGVTRYVYLCDDGNDATKRAWLEERYGSRGDVVYVAGRVRAKGEVRVYDAEWSFAAEVGGCSKFPFCCSTPISRAVTQTTTRTTQKKQINGKSANLNNCLKNVIYGSGGGSSGGNGTGTAEPSSGAIPPNEIVVVFDADMRAKRNFFCKVGEACVCVRALVLVWAAPHI